MNRVMLILVCAVIAVGLAGWLIGAFSMVQTAEPWTRAGIIAFAILVAFVIWRIVSARLK